jgi:hypothetical protein
MTISAAAIFDVADQSPVSAEVTAIIQPPVGAGTGGRGRLVHPTLGAYDYSHTPDETVDLDGDVLFAPAWAHAATLGGGVDAVWSGHIRDALVVERWAQGDVGCPIAHLRMLLAMRAELAPVDAPVLWAPNYATARTYKVAIVDVRAGGERVTLNRRLLSYGYAPQPVELELRILGRADAP